MPPPVFAPSILRRAARGDPNDGVPAVFGTSIEVVDVGAGALLGPFLLIDSGLPCPTWRGTGAPLTVI